MERKLEELKSLLHDLLGEVADLKERVTALERGLGASPVAEKASMLTGQETRANLEELYRDGYHICPVAYGRLRDAECLFCVNFLEKRT